FAQELEQTIPVAEDNQDTIATAVHVDRMGEDQDIVVETGEGTKEDVTMTDPSNDESPPSFKPWGVADTQNQTKESTPTAS
ncbi:hypothetical protein A2U01_0093342, partial [Trifolium medium]|nr:hypothetical protein [Trifolium medium]